jgi:rod shape-determining protein MreC
VYDKTAVRRRRAVLGVLVASSLVLLTFFFGDSVPTGLRAVQRGVQVVLSPLESGASRALKPFRDMAGWTGDVFYARGENERLRSEIARTRSELARAHTDARELAALRGLARLSRRVGYPGGTQPVTGRVIARSPTVWYSKAQINSGSDDGVEVGDPVVTRDGLVGRVSMVNGGSSVITLITDEQSAVSAQVMPGGSGGVVKPEVGKPNDLLLDYIERGRKVRRGTMVLTSGTVSSKLESLFPRGIPIGRVRQVDPAEFELYQRVHIEPFADIRRLDFVQVLTDGPEAEEEEVSFR